LFYLMQMQLRKNMNKDKDKVGVIGGTNLFDTGLMAGCREEELKTKYGDVHLFVSPDFVFIPRHGRYRNIPPHRINHRANIVAFKMLGIDRVIGVTSVGSLKKEIKPGSLLVPHDYISLCNIPTFFDDEIVHITPGLDSDLRNELIEAAKAEGIPVIDGGIYFQSVGPRLETKAEINFISDYADVVGMSMGAEATLAKELGLRYANLSSVDNYAHGIAEEELSYQRIVEAATKMRENIERVLLRVFRDDENSGGF